MKLNKFKKKLHRALNRLLEKDGDLIRYNLSERSICHRLGVYLYEAFQNYDVDCEYNGFEESPRNKKIINILRDRLSSLNRLQKGDLDEEILERRVFPDIIIHRRRRDENLLIIETKKSTNTKQEDIDFDFEKLSRFTSNNFDNKLNYDYGLFINFIVDDEPSFELTWFRNGSQVTEDEL